MRNKIITFLLAVAALLGGGSYLGSVTAGNEYTATTTASTFGGTHRQLKVGPGALGNVTIASTSAHSLTLWNATSTTDSASTTIVTFKASASDGTYTFDASFDRGLVVSAEAGYQGSAVVGWR